MPTKDDFNSDTFNDYDLYLIAYSYYLLKVIEYIITEPEVIQRILSIIYKSFGNNYANIIYSFNRLLVDKSTFNWIDLFKALYREGFTRVIHNEIEKMTHEKFNFSYNNIDITHNIISSLLRNFYNNYDILNYIKTKFKDFDKYLEKDNEEIINKLVDKSLLNSAFYYKIFSKTKTMKNPNIILYEFANKENKHMSGKKFLEYFKNVPLVNKYYKIILLLDSLLRHDLRTVKVSDAIKECAEKIFREMANEKIAKYGDLIQEIREYSSDKDYEYFEKILKTPNSKFLLEFLTLSSYEYDINSDVKFPYVDWFVSNWDKLIAVLKKEFKEKSAPKYLINNNYKLLNSLPIDETLQLPVPQNNIPAHILVVAILEHYLLNVPDFEKAMKTIRKIREFL